MEALLDSIRLAIKDGASDDERRRGIAACRAVADAIDGGTLVGEAGGLVGDVADAPLDDGASESDVPASVTPTTALALGAPTDLAPAAAPVVANPLASNPFAGLTADQILELAIAKLRGAVGNDTTPTPVGQPFRLTLVPLPRFP